MRFVLALLILFFAAAGAVFGALNSESIAYDFYFTTPHLPKGAALLLSLLIGWLLGGALVYFGLVLRLRRRLRAQARELRQPSNKAAPDLTGSSLEPRDSPLAISSARES